MATLKLAGRITDSGKLEVELPERLPSGDVQVTIKFPDEKTGPAMGKDLLRIFQREVERQARFGLIAAQDLEKALGSGDMARNWYSIQSLLIAAGNVSKLLWPGSPIVPRRGEKLRASLGVPNDSVLESRNFRNIFEHFDERLERWAASSQRKNLVDSNIGPIGMISGPEPGDFLRNFDDTEYALTFCGETCLLNPVIEALRELHARASVESHKSHWE